MTPWRRALRLICFTIAAVVVYFTVPLGVEETPVAQAVTGVVGLVLLTAGVGWQVIVHLEDPDRRVDGLLFALVISVLAFGLGFYRLATADPGQIVGLETRLDALYFTMTTLLTVGYGDIHAAGQAARGLVVAVMLFNVLVIATAVTTVSTRVREHAEQRAEARREAQESDEPHPRRRRRKG